MLKPAGPVCNLDCTYCYYLEKKKLYPGKTDFRMSEEMLEEFTRQYIEANDIPVVTFVWQGGEPTLLGIDFFRKAMEFQKKYAGGKAIENAFQTNGTRLNEEWCSFLKDNNMLVGISIDGPEHIHDKFRKTASGGASFKRVMKGIEILQKKRVEFNTLSCVNNYSVHFPGETYSFLKSIGSVFMQFLPIVERKAGLQPDNLLTLVPNNYSGSAEITDWSVRGPDYGKFLTGIFDDWVRSDVGRYYVQIFDTTLANWVGEMPGICVFAGTCGDAMVMEHNGDLFSCDHYVYPEYFLGNISEKPLSEMFKSQRQFDFGIDKRNTLPRYCLICDVRFACHGECPKHRIARTPDGEKGLNWLCEGYKTFFHHVGPYMDFMAKELNNKRAPANVMQWIKNKESQVVKPSSPGRNDPCPCGSGKKFKNCCALKPLYSGLA
ncbi:MAG: anaerobic sulfatase-maturation protein [Bacteroidales bacterium]|jgi:uncharacterized protein|nr:anaerobic sulfatase-maturation protein [Bacteroidales bacterium]